MVKIKELFLKYRELISYVFFGVLTTLVNWLSYIVIVAVLGGGEKESAVVVATAAAQILAIVFAYVTNRKYVFMSKNPKILKEFLSFTASRVITLLTDMIIMWILPPVLYGWKVPYADWVATFISAVVVTILNYIFSKLMVFRKKKTS